MLCNTITIANLQELHECQRALGLITKTSCARIQRKKTMICIASLSIQKLNKVLIIPRKYQINSIFKLTIVCILSEAKDYTSEPQYHDCDRTVRPFMHLYVLSFSVIHLINTLSLILPHCLYWIIETGIDFQINSGYRAF